MYLGTKGSVLRSEICLVLLMSLTFKRDKDFIYLVNLAGLDPSISVLTGLRIDKEWNDFFILMSEVSILSRMNGRPLSGYSTGADGRL